MNYAEICIIKRDGKREDNLIAWLAFNIKFRETFLSR